MRETFQEYTARMLAHAEGLDPFEVLESTADRVDRLIAGHSPDRLRRAPAPGRWSVAEIVAHLADSEIVLGYRVRMILASPGTAIQAFNQDEWSRTQHSERSDPRDTLALFRAVRVATVRLLRSL